MDESDNTRDNDAVQAPQPGAAVTLLSASTLPSDHRDRAIEWRGRLLHIHIAPAASAGMQELEQANLVAGRGIEGDRYFLGTGTYSPKPDAREVTLLEIEVLEALARNDPPLQAGPIRIAPGDHRRNLTVRGVPLSHLVGKRFRIGEVVIRGGRLNYPCKYLEKLVGLPVYQPLYNRSGLNCRIEQGGTIRRGDAIESLED
jgi:MOSC domain-containing protein YiiM